MGTQLRLTPENLAEYLIGRGFARAGQAFRSEPAGDGNINWVRRAWPGDGGSLVVKQARPALERFPEYQVTTERIVYEARYYETVRPVDAARRCPEVLDFDESQRVLLLEDLGDAPRLDGRLGGEPAPGAMAAAGGAIGAFLGAVHAATAGRADLPGRFANDAMRRLHGDHIFLLPFRENDFKLTAPLRARAETLWRDEAITALTDAAYHEYLTRQDALVHGDVQGGNLLLTERGPRLVDAEIAHMGDEAFDLGILVAHLVVAAAARGAAPSLRPAVARSLDAYADARGRGAAPDPGRVFRHAGIELLRRTLGAARLEVVSEDAAGLRVLDLGLRWLREAPASPAAALP